MNALFLDAAGRVFDPVGGLADLRAGRVRFVGDAAARIREDVLRLLRFYRFHAHYGRGAPDAAARRACRELSALLPGLSGERVATELFKLLAAPDPVPTIDLMAEDGVLAVLLPEARRRDRLAGLVALEDAADPLRRLAALLVADPEALLGIAARLRLSSASRERLLRLAAPASAVDLAGDERAQRRALHRLGLDTYRDLVLLRAAETGAAAAAGRLVEAAPRRLPPRFPLRGSDVTQLGVPPSPAVGELLAAVEAWWEAHDFAADRKTCLAHLATLARARGAIPP
jgi:poly(A) polymerase